MVFEGAAKESKTFQELTEQQQQAALDKISGMNDIAELETSLSGIKEIITHWEEGGNEEDLGKERLKHLAERRDLMEQRIKELEGGGGEKTENLRFRLARDFAKEKEQEK